MSAHTPQDPALARPDLVIELTGVGKSFPIESRILKRTVGQVTALTGISLAISAGETLGLVGESGSGKSTLGRVILGLTETTNGKVRIGRTPGDPVAQHGSRIQAVFQNPYASFDPVHPLMHSMLEPVRRAGYDRAAATSRVLELTDQVGLQARHLDRYPDELSGGQLQRLSIARAISVDPSLVVLDEAVSALDLSTQGGIVNLLAELQEQYHVSYLFISHDPSIVYHASHRIAVMYLGEIVEIGLAGTVYHSPRHPYTQALLSAVPVPDPRIQKSRRRIVLPGDVPDASSPPDGCRFHTRCPYVMDICRTERPPTFTVPGEAVEVHCHLHTTGAALRGRPLPADPTSPLRSRAHDPPGRPGPSRTGSSHDSTP